MFFSKSAFFTIALASMFVTEASAFLLEIEGEVVDDVELRRGLEADGRRLNQLTVVRFNIRSENLLGCPDTTIKAGVAPRVQFGFNQDFQPNGVSFLLRPDISGFPPITLSDGTEPIDAPGFLVGDANNIREYAFSSANSGVVPFQGLPTATPFQVAGLGNLVGQVVTPGTWILEVSSDIHPIPFAVESEKLAIDLQCENGSIEVPGVIGDPHFTTFGASHHYDFQGACDLVTVQNNGYKNGKGMHVHVRTTNYGSWSSTTSAAVKIGDDVLEVHGEDLALINGVEYPVPAIVGSEFNFPMTIGDYSLTVQILGPHSRRHIIHMGDGEKIMINNFKEFVDIEFQGDKPEDYNGAVGMLGAFSNHGAMIGRDGKTIFEDADAFGQEWQVRPTDPHLFHVIDGPQYPAHCQMPEQPTAEQRHLRAMSKKVSEDNAKKACAGALKMENCIADVFGSDNLEMANIYTMGNL